jgi:hypothetical protein
MATRAQGASQELRFVTNVGEEVVVDAGHRLVVGEAETRPSPTVQMREGIAAKLSRPVYYELVDLAVKHGGRTGVWSCGEFFAID